MKGEWLAPECTPIGGSNIGDKVNDWLSSNVWVYVFLPFTHQKHNLMLILKDYKCIHCRKKCLQINQYAWRPMFYYDKIVWLLHRRFNCTNCGRTCASIDPKFLSQLPSIVLENFPFVTSNNTPGMHVSMIHQFCKLATNRILFSTYVDMINELHSVKYYKTMLLYYDCTYEFSKKNIFKKEVYPIPFPSFESKGEYNGIKLTKNLVKKLFLEFMRSQEAYMQKSFQCHHDEGAVGDHTHKYSLLIKSSTRKGNVFTASYTTMSLIGHVTSSHLTFTKSNAEIEPIISKIKQIRENCNNNNRLLRYETDNVNGDATLWEAYFPSLLQDTQRYAESKSKFQIPKATISSE